MQYKWLITNRVSKTIPTIALKGEVWPAQPCYVSSVDIAAFNEACAIDGSVIEPPKLPDHWPANIVQLDYKDFDAQFDERRLEDRSGSEISKAVSTSVVAKLQDQVTEPMLANSARSKAAEPESKRVLEKSQSQLLMEDLSGGV